jgi:hypothetical protein
VLFAICAGAPAAQAPKSKKMQRLLTFTVQPPPKLFLFFSCCYFALTERVLQKKVQAVCGYCVGPGFKKILTAKRLACHPALCHGACTANYPAMKNLSLEQI